jgi:hypothetical protein
MSEHRQQDRAQAFLEAVRHAAEKYRAGGMVCTGSEPKPSGNGDTSSTVYPSPWRGTGIVSDRRTD